MKQSLLKIIQEKPDSPSMILGRVSEATRDSAITVFEYHKKLYSVFSATHRTQLQLKENIYKHVGTFHREMDKDTVKLKLERAMA
jgi:hypothetical protein